MNRAYHLISRINKNLLLPKCTYSTECGQLEFTVGDVPGLSKKVVDVPPDEEVGSPKASKTACYKNPEYFCYHINSYYEAEVEMSKHRLPQPSNKTQKQSF